MCHNKKNKFSFQITFCNIERAKLNWTCGKIQVWNFVKDQVLQCATLFIWPWAPICNTAYVPVRWISKEHINEDLIFYFWKRLSNTSLKQYVLQFPYNLINDTITIFFFISVLENMLKITTREFSLRQKNTRNRTLRGGKSS